MKKNIIVGQMLLVVVLGAVIACSGSFRNYGLIKPSEVATGDFESFNVRDRYRYYTSGSDLYPNALLALRDDVRLDPGTLWKRVAMSPGKMKELVGDMKAKVSGPGGYLYGFELTMPDGRPVGAWYSIPAARTMLRVNDDGTIWIETPDIDTYEKLEVEVDRK